jgi:hypothetical protein
MTPRKSEVVLEDEILDVGDLRWAAKTSKAYYQFEHPGIPGTSDGLTNSRCLEKNEMVIALGPCVTISGGAFFTRCLSQHGVIWVDPTGLRTRENSPY